MLESLTQAINFVLHLDPEKLKWLIEQVGTNSFCWVMFAIIFCETGLVVTPFLPGDSLLFALGALCQVGVLDLSTLLIMLWVAAIAGDSMNYWLGSLVGPRIFRGEQVRWLNKKHLERTHEFFERYGGKTIIIARFVPIVRTFAPFVAGMGRMTYARFMTYNVIGGLLWIVSFLVAGYFFARLPWVEKNFKLVILGIIVVSVLPAVFEVTREWLRHRKSGGTGSATPESAASGTVSVPTAASPIKRVG